MVDKLCKLFLFPIFAVVTAAFYYGGYLNNFFACDDFKYLENMYRGRIDLALGYGSLRLISNLSWLPLFAVSGVDPFGYNLFAFIIYVANSILLYFLLVRLLPDRVTAFLASAFFVAGSAGADAVFWKATNSSLISLFFYLFTLIFYADYRRTGLRKRYIWAIAFYIFAIFSKEEAASLPFIAALIDIVFFKGWQNKRDLFHRILPFCAIIFFYIISNYIIFNYLLGTQAAPQTVFKLRPLYSLLGGGTAFFLAPDGFISVNSLPVYITVLFILLSFILMRNKRLLLFGYIWIFLAFFPQSLTGLGQFEPQAIVNSISRYLYITSIGVSIVFAVVTTGIRERVPNRIWYGLAGSILAIYICVHYPRVRERGVEWQNEGDKVENFINEMKRVRPILPSPSYILMGNRPTGLTFTEQALRAFYGNTEIILLRKPYATRVHPVFFVDYWCSPETHVKVNLLW